MSLNYKQFLQHLDVLNDCTVCPRNCHANRFENAKGYCRTDARFHISSVCVHHGEEPVISGREGICNIFFSHCNLRCIYCQNHQISRNCSENLNPVPFPDLVEKIISILDNGIRRVGFVSPSHFVPHVKAIIDAVESTGRKPVWVYNTNAYDKTETLRQLEGLIDVYLPDLKYLENELAYEFSDAADYPAVASSAIREMLRQKGPGLITDEDGTAVSGIIIRHLVLPGHVDNSLRVLEFIADQSAKIHVSLMSQYYPVPEVLHHQDLKRSITAGEYEKVKDKMEHLGLHNGWIQEMESSSYYRPDFDMDHPFEK